MKNVFRVRSVKRIRYGRRAMLILSLLFLTASAAARGAIIVSPFTVTNGSGGDNYSVVSYGGSPVSTPTFDSTTGALISPGNGYGSLQSTQGNSQTDTGGIANPSGSLTNGLTTGATGASIPGGNSLFGSGFLSYSASNLGMSWNSYSISDSIIDTKFSTSYSRGIANYQVNQSFSNGQAGVALGIGGFLPTGTQGFASLVATFTLMSPTGSVVQKSEDAVVIYANNISGSQLPNGVENVSVPVTGSTNAGLAANSSSGYSQTIDGNGNLSFGAYGVALLPQVNYVSGDTLSIDATLTLAVDPMATYTFDLLPLVLPNGNPLPLIAAEAQAAPEPASLVMGGTACAIGLGAWLARRRKAR